MWLAYFCAKKNTTAVLTVVFWYIIVELKNLLH